MRTIRIVLTGGGTGGHIYPLIAVVEKLERISVEKGLLMEIRYFGPSDIFRPALEDAGVKISIVFAGKIRRYFSFLNIIDIPKIAIGFIQALFKMYWFMPDVLFSKGGSGAFPVVLTAWFYRIPVIIHDSDAQPGLNNLFSAHFAKRIAVSFEKALSYFDPKKTACVGNPIRSFLLSDKPEQKAAKEKLGFDSEKPLVLFWGGSQGAKRINDLVITDLKDLINETQILHQTGITNFSEVQNLSKSVIPKTLPKEGDIVTKEKVSYLPVPYLELTELKLALAAADLVVARAGSNIFEIAAFSKPSILIPLPESANDHQRMNAYEFAKTGAAKVIEETNLLPGIFMNEIKNTLENKELLGRMSLASGNFFKPQAAEVLAEEILRFSK
ncbi:MAG: UDP-N-acetylglucosamine--N-acetylmuramyl-(pentapeptide) pyrophosphoryl-undecaprenol N-acetylglucosamine transferase [Candidatus Liptonbacteria bacterium]|nr:UDP-N-acetylglucosamine--N-acetylmuramyl-(pentapeptide) pyrophosphoryl-undecaprenol N-acetylglucosamine transferase [Candidatus Liptonbacteria bacterium]